MYICGAIYEFRYQKSIHMFQLKVNKNHGISKCICFLESLNININKVMYTIKWIW